MTYLDEMIDAILKRVQGRSEAIKEARRRRDNVRTAANTFPGARGTYLCGSLAYGTAIRPVSDRDKGVDGDAGVILDRRTWNKLGPDSDENQGPRDAVDQMRGHLRDKLAEQYTALRISTTKKRALRSTFAEPLDGGGEDPPVELVVALERKDAPGLWIPNLKTNGWDAAHPQKHRKLINTDPPRVLRVRRAKVLRLGKWWNKTYSSPAFSSFHQQALALKTLTSAENGRKLISSVETFFNDAADRLDAGMTQDPAGVSGVLKLQNGVTKAIAVQRLRAAGEAIVTARDAPDDKQAVRDALSPLFGDDLVDAADDDVQAAALASGNRSLVLGAGVAAVAVGAAAVGRRLTRREPNAWRRQ